MSVCLIDRQCIPCQGGVPPLTEEEIQPLLQQLSGWEVRKSHHLFKEYRFKDFVTALDFVQRLGDLAEAQGHHPELTLGYGYVRVSIWTHKIDGLSESDFILAAHCDRAHEAL